MDFLSCTTSLLGLGYFLESIECDYNSFERSPIQHMSGWPHWSGIRLQVSDCCVASSIPTGGNIFGKFIFPEFILLSDLLFVKKPTVSFLKHQLL